MTVSQLQFAAISERKRQQIQNISLDTKYITVSHTQASLHQSLAISQYNMQASLHQSLAISQHNMQHTTFAHISLSIQSLRSVCNISISVFRIYTGSLDFVGIFTGSAAFHEVYISMYTPAKSFQAVYMSEVFIAATRHPRIRVLWLERRQLVAIVA